MATGTLHLRLFWYKRKHGGSLSHMHASREGGVRRMQARHPPKMLPHNDAHIFQDVKLFLSSLERIIYV